MQPSAYYLDAAIIRIATLRARELVVRGETIEQAIDLACPGAWSRFRPIVATELRQLLTNKV
jgi:hypothetical protein